MSSQKRDSRVNFMRNRTTVARRGGSLTIRTRDVVGTPSPEEDGTVSEIVPFQGEVERRFELSRLVAAITRENRHREVAWGVRKGGEEWW